MDDNIKIKITPFRKEYEFLTFTILNHFGTRMKVCFDSPMYSKGIDGIEEDKKFLEDFFSYYL